MAAPVLGQKNAVPYGQAPPPQSAADVPQPVAGAPISTEYASAIGRMAYIWGWPLVNRHNRQTLFATRTDPFAEMGIQYKTKPELYLLVGPNWKT